MQFKHVTLACVFLVCCFKLAPTKAYAATIDCYSEPGLQITTVCFTPGGHCTDEIVMAIGKAKQQILVQAYQITSPDIADALIQARARNVDVVMLLDKSQLHEHHSMLCHLLNKGIPILIDKKPAIAHNKVMVIDEKRVVTGSFNFTTNAQAHNAENLIIINDKVLAHAYIQNWHSRERQSVVIDPEQLEHLACLV